MVRRTLSRIIETFRQDRSDREFDDEVRAHLDMLAERFVAQGMTPEEAAYAARRQFGGVTQVKQDQRDRRALSLDHWWQDFRHALRQLWKARGFTASAGLILALGIGATTAVFAVLDTVVLRPLPYPEAGQLMAFRSISTRRGTPVPSSLSYPNYFDFRTGNQVFEHLVSYRDSRFTLSDSLPAIRVPGMIVSWDLFPLLRVRPVLGRGFVAEEERPGSNVVVLSHSLWLNRFGKDPAIVGRSVRINGKDFTVVGVTPAAFEFPAGSTAQLWTTLSVDAESQFTPVTEQRGARMLDVVGRLKPGVTMDQARASMDAIAAALVREYPNQNKNLAKTSVRPEVERLAGVSRTPLWILLGAVSMLLLIACANVANLLLVRTTERAREFAVRTALGASRLAILRQVLIESLALALLGTAAGTLLAFATLQFAVPLGGDRIPRLAQAAVDGRVLAFSIFAAGLTSLFFGVAPALQALRTDPVRGLREGGRSLAGGNDRLRGAFVVGQITLGLVLLVGGEVLMTSFLHLARRDPGFRPSGLLTFNIGIARESLGNAGVVDSSNRLLEELTAIPGVESAAMGMPMPLEGDEMSIGFDIEQRRVPPPQRPMSNMSIVTPRFFSTMGIPLLKGRHFTENDDADAPRVLIVNQAFANKFFPGEDAIGKRIEPGATNGAEGPRMREIVGVVGNAKQIALSADPDPIYYFPYKQLSWGTGTFVVRTAVPPLQVESAARRILTKMDREAAMFQVQTGEERASVAIAPMRFLTTLVSGFAVFALLLTVFGLYGVLSYAVSRRQREIGLRIALGAGRGEVLGLILRGALRLLAIGIALGLAGVAACLRVLETLTFGIQSKEPLLLAGACMVLACTSMLAAYIPARRATAVDPVQALRSE